MLSDFKILLSYLQRKRKVQLSLLILLTLFGTFLEVFSLGLIFPFITLFLDPSTILENKIIKPYLDTYSITTFDDLYLPLTISFFLITSLSYLIRSMLIFIRSKLSRVMIQEISSLLYWRIINEDYEFHVNQNSGDIITGVTKSIGVAASFILPMVRILNSTFLIFFAIIGTIIFDPRIAIIIIGSLFVFYYVIVVVINKTLNSYSDIQNNNYSKLIKLLQESLGAIKIIILNKAQIVFYKNYNKITNEYLRSISMVEFIGLIPKLLFEYTILLFILLAIYFLKDLDNLTILIPSIITFLIAIQRLLPEVNSLYSNLVKIKTNRSSTQRVINYLKINELFPDKIIEKDTAISFNKIIEFKNISFRYKNETNTVLSNINLKIKKGQRVGIIGESGSGKSTLIDLLSGIIKQSSGSILIDNKELNTLNLKNWQNQINVVSQNTYLFDSSIAENIAFTNQRSLIDLNKVEEICEIAGLSNFISSQKEGVFSHIGERGVKISGGQLQRIGIARALYKRSQILILDEATSALDQETESLVMNNIFNFSRNSTIIIVAHRLSSLKNCDLIFELKKNQIIVYNSYSKMVKKINK